MADRPGLSRAAFVAIGAAAGAAIVTEPAGADAATALVAPAPSAPSRTTRWTRS